VLLKLFVPNPNAGITSRKLGHSASYVRCFEKVDGVYIDKHTRKNGKGKASRSKTLSEGVDSRSSDTQYSDDKQYLELTLKEKTYKSSTRPGRSVGEHNFTSRDP
jgi:hypothetical protein